MRKNIKKILCSKKKNAIWFFDFDGVLCESRFHNKCSFVDEDMNFLETCIKKNPYKKAKPVKIMQKFLSKLPSKNIYVLGQSNNTLENRHKIKFIKKHFPMIPENHIFFVNSKEAKCIGLHSIKQKLNIKNCYLVEDNYDTILLAETKYNISCFHISSFL